MASADIETFMNFISLELSTQIKDLKQYIKDQLLNEVISFKEDVQSVIKRQAMF